MKLVTTSTKRNGSKTAVFWLLTVIAVLSVIFIVLHSRDTDKSKVVFCSFLQVHTNVVATTEIVETNAHDSGFPAAALQVQTQAQEAFRPASSKSGETSDIVIDAKGIMRAADTNNFVKRPGYLMLPSGRILTFKPPAKGETVKVHSFGKVYECDSEGNFEEITRKPVFDNAFENQLVGLATPGATFLPTAILNHTPEELDEMLKKPVVINPDDDEDVIYKKQAVAEMKKMIRAYLNDGGDFIDFVQQMQTYSKEERSLRGNGMGKLEEIMDSGDLEKARSFIETYNQILDENNFAPLRLPKKWREELYPDGMPEEKPSASDE